MNVELTKITTMLLKASRYTIFLVFFQVSFITILMNVDYHLYNVMLDYIDCNIQAHILYVINADNTILYYTLYMIILVCTALHKAFVFL